VFQEEFITSTIEISKALPQFLVDTCTVDKEVQVVDVDSTDKEEPVDVDIEEESKWDYLKTDTKHNDNEIQYRSSDDDDVVDDEDDDY